MRATIPRSKSLEDFNWDHVDPITTQMLYNFDYKYLRKLRSLRERLPQFKLCNEHRCPLMKRRLQDHLRKCHTSDTHIPQNEVTQNDTTQNDTPQNETTENKTTENQITENEATENEATENETTENEATENDGDPTETDTTQNEDACEPVNVTKEFLDRTVQTILETVKDAETSYSERNVFRPQKELVKITVSSGSQINSFDIPKRSQSCNTTVSFKNVYKDRVQYEVLQWLREVPIEAAFNSTAKILTERTVNNLIRTIDQLLVEAKNDDYIMKLKFSIEHCLNSLPLLYHSAKCLKAKLILTESLITRILVLNSKYLNYSSSYGFQDRIGIQCTLSSIKIDETPLTKIVKQEILSWLGSKLLTINGEALDESYVTTMLLKRLLPVFNGTVDKNFRYLLRGAILDVLLKLSPKLGFANNRIFLNSLATELMQRILNVTTKYEKSAIYHSNVYSDFIIKRYFKNPKHMFPLPNNEHH